MPFWNFAVKNEGTPEEDVELRIDGEIVSDDDAWLYEYFGIKATSPNAFRTELEKYKGKPLSVWIDSWGGDTTAGAGIYNALKEHKGKITVKIDGKAVSAASIIAMAGEEIKISPVGIMMIHNPWTIAAGESKDMLQTATILDEVKEGIINAYQLKTKKSRNKIAEMMDNETWMSAKTAVKEGFADSMLYTEANTPPIENSFMFSRLAIQNSVSESTRRFIEQYKKIEAAKNPPPKPEESQQSLVNLYALIKTRNGRRKTHV